MAEFASNGKANAGLATGIIGTVLGGLATLGGGASLMGLGKTTSYENTYATMHDLDDVKALAEKDSEIAQLKAQQIVDAKIVDTYKELANKINALDKEQDAKWSAQYVVNANLQSAVSVLSSQEASTRAILDGLTKVVIPYKNVCPIPAIANPQPTDGE